MLMVQPTGREQGNEMLAQICGEKDVSRTVSDDASAQSVLDTGLLKEMLPMLEMLVAGYMAKQGGQTAGGGAPAGGLGGMLGNALGRASCRERVCQYV